MTKLDRRTHAYKTALAQLNNNDCYAYFSTGDKRGTKVHVTAIGGQTFDGKGGHTIVYVSTHEDVEAILQWVKNARFDASHSMDESEDIYTYVQKDPEHTAFCVTTLSQGVVYETTCEEYARSYAEDLYARGLDEKVGLVKVWGSFVGTIPEQGPLFSHTLTHTEWVWGESIGDDTHYSPCTPYDNN